MNGFLSSLIVLLALFGSNNGQRVCNWDTFVQPRAVYELKNLEYPEPYVGGSSCRWVFKARWDQRVKIQCHDISIPSDQYCLGDRLEIQDGVGRTSRFCAPLQYTSYSSRLTITLRSFPSHFRGRFRCTVEAVQPNACDCGRRNAPKIHNGVQTGPNEYPFMAAIMDVATEAIICGGTIINNRQVLTAAHCLKDRRIGTFGVLVGAHNLQKVEDTPGARFFLAASAIVHETYMGPNVGLDIGIVTVSREIIFNETVSPVCLPFQRPLDSFANQHTDILGWGADSLIGGPLNLLMKAQVGVTTPGICKNYYPGSSDHHMCTYDDNKDSCAFDSGGPLTIQTETSRKVIQIGIMNKGPACGGGQTALNLRVGPLLPWIFANSPRDFTYCLAE